MPRRNRWIDPARFDRYVIPRTLWCRFGMARCIETQRGARWLAGRAAHHVRRPAWVWRCPFCRCWHTGLARPPASVVLDGTLHIWPVEAAVAERARVRELLS